MVGGGGGEVSVCELKWSETRVPLLSEMIVGLILHLVTRFLIVCVWFRLLFNKNLSTVELRGFTTEEVPTSPTLSSVGMTR